jgi:non-homologous end joining protein Ku
MKETKFKPILLHLYPNTLVAHTHRHPKEIKKKRKKEKRIYSSSCDASTFPLLEKLFSNSDK